MRDIRDIADVSSIIPVLLALDIRVVHLPIFATGHVGNLMLATIDTRISDTRTIFNLEARAVHYGLRGHILITVLSLRFVGRTVETRQVLVQLDQQFTVFAFLIGYNSDIAIHEVVFLRAVLDFSLDSNGPVQLNRSAIAEITDILHTVIHRGDLMSNDSFGLAIFVGDGRLVLDTG